jgi:hypothetical protein
MKMEVLGWLEAMAGDRNLGILIFFSEIMANSIIWKDNYVVIIADIFNYDDFK